MLGKFGKIHPLKSAGECRGYVMRSFPAKYVFLHVARIQIPMTDDVGWNAVGLEVLCLFNVTPANKERLNKISASEQGAIAMRLSASFGLIVYQAICLILCDAVWKNMAREYP